MSNIIFENSVDCGREIGLITLNRPQNLNALDGVMCESILHHLQNWAEQPNIKAVIIKGQGEKAFCAGGDIKAIYQLCRQGYYQEAEQFFMTEYAMNQAIFNFPKPYIAFLNGITMGGGVGLSIHGSFSVGTERLMWAMPETKIGFFPDVGACYALARLPPPISRYLALTGVKINAGDAFELGLITAIVDSAEIHNLEQSLISIRFESGDFDSVEEIISRYHNSNLSIGTLFADIDEINQAFNFDVIEKIFSHLEQKGSEWCQQTLKILQSQSPTSLKVTLEHLEHCRHLSFAQVMEENKILCRHFLRSHDFMEGVRALLIDKDNKPQWQPAK